MRIGISGAHRTGKSTLAETLIQALPHYELIPEPYILSADEGEPLAAIPDFDSFQLLLRMSLQTTLTSPPNSILDRCPFDMLAYLISHPESSRLDLKAWRYELQAAIQGLDLIAFVPIESPDRFSDVDYPRLRQRVDRELRRLIVDDYFGYGVPAIEVAGSVEERLRAILNHLSQ